MATLLFRNRQQPPREPALEPSLARPAPEPTDPDDDDGKRDRWWYESSYDLRCGLEVDDEAGDTIPGDVFDRLFVSKP